MSKEQELHVENYKGNNPEISKYGKMSSKPGKILKQRKISTLPYMNW